MCCLKTQTAHLVGETFFQHAGLKPAGRKKGARCFGNGWFAGRGFSTWVPGWVSCTSGRRTTPSSARPSPDSAARWVSTTGRSSSEGSSAFPTPPWRSLCFSTRGKRSCIGATHGSWFRSSRPRWTCSHGF